MSALVPVPGRDDRDVCYATFLRSFLRAIRTRQDGGLKFKIIVCGEVALESCCSDGDNAEVRCTHSGANDCMWSVHEISKLGFIVLSMCHEVIKLLPSCSHITHNLILIHSTVAT